MPQGSVFNISLNELYLFITKASHHNYAHDNTFPAYSFDLTSLTDILIEQSQTTTNWLKANHMIVNPKKFQTMLASKENTPYQRI